MVASFLPFCDRFLILLHLADNLTSTTETFDHLLAFLSSADGVIALPEKFVKLGVLIHVLEEFTLHFILRVPVKSLACPFYFKIKIDVTYWTRVSITAFGTISIKVRFTIL